MSKSSDQKLKLLYILEYIFKYTDEEHKCETSDIINYLNVNGISSERKSIYSDMEELKKFGYDINTVRNKSNHYWIGERRFELPELKLLVDAVQSCRFITENKSAQLIKKLEGLTSVSNRKQLQRQVETVNRIKSMNESVYINIDAISRAISENKKISFKYYEWKTGSGGTEHLPRKNGKEYIISPWSLLWANENYYVISYFPEHENKSHFRVDKMKAIEILDEARDGEAEFKNFSTAGYYRKTFEMFSGKSVFVDLRLKNELIGVIMDRFGEKTIIRKCGKDYFETTVEVILSQKFFSWVYGMGEGIKILSPSDVISRFIEYTKKITAIYE